MIFFVCSNIIIAITSLSLAFFVYFNNKKSSLTLPFLLMNISITLWSFGLAMMVISKSAVFALLWSRPHYLGCIFIPPTFLHLILSIFNQIEKKKRVLKGCYFFAFVVLVLLVSGVLIKEPVAKFVFNYYTVPNDAYFLFMLEFFTIIAYTIYLIVKRIFHVTGIERIRSVYLLMAALVAVLGGVPAFFPVINIYTKAFLYCNILIIFYPILMAYAIVKHRLMDIEVIIRETAVFAGIFGFSVGIFMLAIVAGEQFLQPYIGQSQWLVPALSLLLVTFAIRPIEKLVYNVIGKHLFRKKFEYQKILRDASVGMSTVRDPKKLLGLIVHIVSMKIRLSNVSILIYDKKQSLYKIKASRNKGRLEDTNMTLSAENPLIGWLSEKKKPLTLDEVQRWNKDDSSHSSKSVLTSDLVQIEHRMKDLGAAVCVPSFYRDELLGILVLGEKKSGDFFLKDDLDLFSALADESAIALKNSQLYFEIDKKANEFEDLYKREHRLFMHASVAFAAAIDARDPYTHGHSERVTNFSLAILDCMGAVFGVDKNPLFRQRLQIATVLHDIGKIGVPDDILHKPSKLSDKEWESMRKHPVTGAEIVAHIKGLHDLIGGIKHHHERYDGKGYPDGLKSDEIPFMAKIIAVADTFDAMISDRPYRKGLPVEVAREEIQRNAAAQFDPYMVAAFLKAYEQGDIKKSAIYKKVELLID